MYDSDLRLVFINRIGVNAEGDTEYTLYYTDTPDDVWAEDFPEQVPSACYIENLIPAIGTYTAIKQASSKTDISLIQDNSCFSFQDCIDGVIALAWVMGDDGNYYYISYGETMEASDRFLEKYGFKLGQLVEVDNDKVNNTQDYDDDLDTDFLDDEEF